MKLCEILVFGLEQAINYFETLPGKLRLIGPMALHSAGLTVMQLIDEVIPHWGWRGYCVHTEKTIIATQDKEGNPAVAAGTKVPYIEMLEHGSGALVAKYPPVYTTTKIGQFQLLGLQFFYQGEPSIFMLRKGVHTKPKRYMSIIHSSVIPRARSRIVEIIKMGLKKG